MTVFKPQLHLAHRENLAAVGENPPVRPPIDKHDGFVERLYHQYRTSLSHYVAGMLPGGQQDAEVIIQETYIRLLRQSSLEHLQANARAYIFTIATNLVRDSLRKQVRRCGDAHEPLREEEH